MNRILKYIAISLSILSVFTKEETFCGQYEKNDRKVLIHSPDNENVILAIKSFYWIASEVKDSDSSVRLEWSYKGTDQRDPESYGYDIMLNKATVLFSVGASVRVRMDSNNESSEVLVTDLLGFYEVRQHVKSTIK